jgi:hypothetical protein
LLELGGPAPQADQAPPARVGRQLAEQPCLAHAQLTDEPEEKAGAATRCVEGLPEDAQRVAPPD